MNIFFSQTKRNLCLSAWSTVRWNWNSNLRYPNRKIEVVAVLGPGVVEFKKGNSAVTSEQMEGDKKGALVQSQPPEVQGKARQAVPCHSELIETNPSTRPQPTVLKHLTTKAHHLPSGTGRRQRLRPNIPCSPFWAAQIALHAVLCEMHLLLVDLVALRPDAPYRRRTAHTSLWPHHAGRPATATWASGAPHAWTERKLTVQATARGRGWR
jgi:hypothetical protein